VCEASNLHTVKPIPAHRTANIASDQGRTKGTLNTARKRKKQTWKANTLRIGSWNIISWTNKEQEVIMDLIKHRIDICGLSETKKKGKGSIRYQNYILFYSGSNKNQRAHAGIGIIIHEIFEKYIDRV